MTANQIAYWNLQEQKRSNTVKEEETERSNRARELETNRANLENEALKTRQLNIDTAKAVTGGIKDVGTAFGSVLKGIGEIIPL